MASLGTLVAAAWLVFPGPAEDAGPIREVAAVRHAKVSAPPQRPDVRTMVASYYASSLAGNPTADGGTYRPERHTAAHRTLPLGTRLRISHGGRSVDVVVNDRGPYAPGHDLDLSLAAAREIGLVEPGTAPVRVAVL